MLIPSNINKRKKGSLCEKVTRPKRLFSVGQAKQLSPKANFTGFTLIELLVVISIIGLLSSIVLSSLSSARAKARDAHRMSDIKQIFNAITLYASDHDGAAIGVLGWAAQINNTCAGWGQIYNLIAPTYISKVPEDPLSSGPPTPCSVPDGYWYYYFNNYRNVNGSITATGNISDFVVCAKLENPKISITNPFGNAINFCLST